MSIGIAGGGISGLSFALKASRISSKPIRIYEKDAKLGGWIQTVRTDYGAIFECGPRSVRFAKQKEARFSISLLNELGLEKDIIARDKTHPSSKYRFLWVDGKLHKLPYDIKSALKTLPFMKSSLLWQGAKGVLTPMETLDENATLYDLIETRFGEDMAKYLVDSVTRGIYGTSARYLTVENALPVASFLKTPGGPLRLRNAYFESRPPGHNQPNLLPYYPFYVKQSELKGVKAWNLVNGLHGLIEKMVDKCEKQNVDIKTNCGVESVSFQENEIILNDSYGCSNFVSALSPSILSDLLRPSLPHLSNLLSQYGETSLNVYLVELSEKELPKENGFGFLVPSCEDKSLLGVTYDSCVFPEHDSPQGGSRYTIMSAEPLDDLHKVLNKTLGIESPIRWQKHLEATIPLYNAWHRDNNERVKSLAAKKGITLIGNYFNGVAVNNCIYHSIKAAEDLLQVQTSYDRLLATKF